MKYGLGEAIVPDHGALVEHLSKQRTKNLGWFRHVPALRIASWSTSYATGALFVWFPQIAPEWLRVEVALEQISWGPATAQAMALLSVCFLQFLVIQRNYGKLRWALWIEGLLLFLAILFMFIDFDDLTLQLTISTSFLFRSLFFMRLHKAVTQAGGISTKCED